MGDMSDFALPKSDGFGLRLKAGLGLPKGPGIPISGQDIASEIHGNLL